MEIFFGIVCVLIWASFSFLHASLATDADFCPTLTFHLLQTIATRSDEQAKEINLWELLNRDVDFVGWPLGALLLVILHGRPEVGVVFHGTINKFNALVFELFAVTNFTGVSPTSMCIVGGGWRGRSKEFVKYMQANAIKIVRTDLSRSGGMKSFNLSLRLISSNRKWMA
jgi:hypothetical protein